MSSLAGTPDQALALTAPGARPASARRLSLGARVNLVFEVVTGGLVELWSHKLRSFLTLTLLMLGVFALVGPGVAWGEALLILYIVTAGLGDAGLQLSVGNLLMKLAPRADPAYFAAFNTLTGLMEVSPQTLEAAKGMGMNPRQRLMQVELPLALPVILAGIRLSVIISLGTATIGSTVAAKGLGEVIIAGLQSNNVAFVLQGGLVVALLAVLIHDGLGIVERVVAGRLGRPVDEAP